VDTTTGALEAAFDGDDEAVDAVVDEEVEARGLWWRRGSEVGGQEGVSANAWFG
jgi:hypothetical protein